MTREATIEEPQTQITVRVNEARSIEVPTPVRPDLKHGQYNVGTFLAHRLEQLGVKDYFVVPGDYNLALLDQLLKNETLQMIGCCNELNAGYAADGYARSSPARVAVVIVTYMVGGLSAINAIAGAYSENLRVVVVSGCPVTDLLSQDGILHHTLGGRDRDQSIRMFSEVTAAAVRLDKRDAAGQIDGALRECLSRSLPVYIEIPADMADMTCEAPAPPLRGITYNPLQLPGRVSPACENIVRTWKAAKNPVLIVGARVRDFISQNTIVALMEKLGCAVLCHPDAKALAPEDHPQFMGTFWPGASEEACQSVVGDSDLWVVLGGRWTDFHTLFGTLDLRRESDRILDVQPGFARTPDGQVFDEALPDVVRSLIESDIAPNPASIPVVPPKRQAVDLLRSAAPGSPLRMAHILSGIQNLITRHDTLIVETGDSWFSAQELRLPAGADFHIQMVYGSIGWSLPATLGCQVALPGGRAILMIGDGSFQMTAQELSTMVRLRANPIILIINNLGYQIECAIHDGPYNYISNWNYTLFAQALSNDVDHAGGGFNPYASAEERRLLSSPAMFAMRIRTTDDLSLALQRAVQEKEKLALLECCVQPQDVSEGLRRFGDAMWKRYAVNAG